MKKATKAIFILIILGAFALTGGGCGKEEEFDFSSHMRIDERVDQIDWSGFERLEESTMHPRTIKLDGFVDGSVRTVKNENLRITGVTSIFGYFKATLNGETVPYGNLDLYYRLKNNKKIPDDVDYAPPSTISFFVDLVLSEGRNTIEFIYVYPEIKKVDIKRIYIDYESKN
jgi:hypothetical protein